MQWLDYRAYRVLKMSSRMIIDHFPYNVKNMLDIAAQAERHSLPNDTLTVIDEAKFIGALPI